MYGFKTVFYENMIHPLSTHVFEDVSFPISKDAHTVLKNAYNDYWNKPHAEKSMIAYTQKNSLETDCLKKG